MHSHLSCEKISLTSPAAAAAGGVLLQVCEERIAELSSRLASQESKVGQLKAERQELYQKLAAAAEATRNQVRCNRTQKHTRMR
jgi:uncharacterized coiled-coil protein SlyX